jgi:hypothetical protein
VFCLCGGGGFLIRPVLYSLQCSMFLVVFLSVPFAFAIIGHLCK